MKRIIFSSDTLAHLGSLQSLDRTGGLDWWTRLLCRLHLALSFTDSSKHILSLEGSTIGNTDAAWKESYWLLDYMYLLIVLTDWAL